MNVLGFAARSLRREFRHGELATLVAALVLAVAALTAVGTLTNRVEQAMLASTADLVGGDLDVSAPRAGLGAEFADMATRLGLEHSRGAEFASVVFAGEASQFSEIRAFDAAFPLRGKLGILDAAGQPRDVHGPESGTVFVDPAILTTLKRSIGASLQIGGRDLRIAGTIVNAPGSSPMRLAPTVLMNLADAEAIGLLAPGSRARHRLLLAGPEAALAEYVEWARPRLADGARLNTLADARTSLRAAFERGENFLNLAALLAALLAGIAVALAAQRFARRKVEDVALLRCLGASRNEIVQSLILQLALLALPASLCGAVLGIGLQEVAFALARSLLGGTSVGLPLGPAAAAFCIGLAVLFGFALPPLLRLRDVAPMRVFRREWRARPRRFDLLYALPVCVAAGLILLQSSSTTLAVVLACGLFGVALVTTVVCLALLRLLRALSARVSGALRFGIANLGRRRSLTLIQVGALALSLTALDLLAVIGPSLLDRWRAELPTDTPNYFVINLQEGQRATFAEQLAQLDADHLNLLPLAPGKLVAINGKPPRAEDYSDPDRAGNWIDGEVRLSWSEAMPSTNRILAGQWNASPGDAAGLSVEEGFAKLFGLELGDQLTLRFGSDEVTATVTSLREVDWQSFSANFFMMLDPAHADGLAHSLVASFHLDAEASALSPLMAAMPNLSLFDINAILDRIRELIGRVSAAVTWVLGFSLAAGLLVLLAALAATADERRFEMALLRTLGAHRRQLDLAVLGEFATLGLLAGLVAALGAALTGMALATEVFRMEAYLPPFGTLALVTSAAAMLVMLAGLVASLRIARTPPMRVLRHATA